jgi:Flp pilus assembly protein TadG
MKMQKVQNRQAARRSKHSAASGSVSGKARPTGGRLLALLRRGDEGQALMETALVLALVVLPLVSGIFSIGLSFENQQALAQAVGLGGAYLSQADGNTTDPCAGVMSAITGSAPQLIAANVSLTITMGQTLSSGVLSGGTSESGPNCSGSQTNLSAGTYVTVAATYPCSIGVYGVNLVPHCILAAKVNELSY